MLTWKVSRSTTRRDHHRIPLVLIEGMRTPPRESTWNVSKGRAARTRPDASDQAISKESEASIVCDYEVQCAEEGTPAITTVPDFQEYQVMSSPVRVIRWVLGARGFNLAGLKCPTVLKVCWRSQVRPMRIYLE